MILGKCDGGNGCWWKFGSDNSMMHSDPYLHVPAENIESVKHFTLEWMTPECYERLRTKSKLPMDARDTPRENPPSAKAVERAERAKRAGIRKLSRRR
jgi:hypothetical protein